MTRDRVPEREQEKDVLIEARYARLAGRMEAPSRLYALAGNDGDRFRHAMREMGAIVPKLPDGSPGPPEDPCSICGWSVASGSVLNA